MLRLAVLVGINLYVLSSTLRAEDAETFFETRIRPVLAESCLKCHGGKKVSNSLRVDSREALLKGGDSGPAIVPGDPDKSLLIQAVRRTHAEIKMPPDKKLPDATVADLATWVKNGANWPKTRVLQTAKHWAFEPLKRTEPPRDLSGWSEHPLDLFVSAKQQASGLRPGASADKRVLLRRITFDLIGLPPTPEEVDAFVKDESPDAWNKVIERLLASPHYGERWGRHWMDVARYADTAGDNADYPIPEIRLYRDYIIDSFNADKPYDRFVREQIAGDILAKQGPAEKYADRVIATGFLALSRRYATAPYELWHLTLEDTIETTGRAFMGLTLRCARCHDHKYDPVTKEDYYALYGIFASTQFPWAGGEEFHSMKKPREHFMPLSSDPQVSNRLAAHQHEMKRVEEEVDQLSKSSPLISYLAELDSMLAARARTISELSRRGQPVDALKQEQAALQRERDRTNSQLQSRLTSLKDRLWQLRRSSLPAGVTGAYAVQEGKPADAAIQIRGEVEKLGPVVHRGVPKFLCNDKPLSIPSDASGRLQLADWLTRPEHPLTARVMVNRIWQHHFGKGIVGTPSNFGTRGDEPTHPELVDYLAARFVESGWSVKAMHRLILSSKTYQIASTYSDVNAQLDPGNRWYWRFDRRRLDAEAIRDALLAVSGNLDRTRPGPHPFPPIERWTWTQHEPFKHVYPTNRRSVYLMTQRFQRHPYLALFDGPDTNTTTEQRPTSTVPLQALFMMNSPFVKEQAGALAQRLLTTVRDPRERIEQAVKLLYGRTPVVGECEKFLNYVGEYVHAAGKTGTPTDRLEIESWTSCVRVLLCANEFVYLD
jgi:hypothetical protein